MKLLLFLNLILAAKKTVRNNTLANSAITKPKEMMQKTKANTRSIQNHLKCNTEQPVATKEVKIVLKNVENIHRMIELTRRAKEDCLIQKNALLKKLKEPVEKFFILRHDNGIAEDIKKQIIKMKAIKEKIRNSLQIFEQKLKEEISIGPNQLNFLKNKLKIYRDSKLEFITLYYIACTG
ncbi:hypothetical protein TUBRATIS_23090 [Tubulinosema ratisbonensis]|uniref:Uncharacterized protein n=1 Tax=Tubulinosema ratisbonensis TaxID=291195 RepID=A0A437AJH6_9MICR|nr:hypothetical protein TUBRATIS_23090 [Tubulinosema ratisbonensis]